MARSESCYIQEKVFILEESLMKNIENLPICLAFDDGYLYPFMVFAYSARANSSMELKFIIAKSEGSLSEESVAMIHLVTEKLGIQVVFLQVPISFDRRWNHVSPVAMQRLFFFDLLEEPFIYMDVDILLSPGWDEIFDSIGILDGLVVRAALDDENFIKMAQL
jgi:lipopolysaccharide biosynthesis glycosyltransferase